MLASGTPVAAAPASRPPRLGEKAGETRARLLAAARTAFASAGYNESNLRRIAAAAGVNVALIPRYFGSKEQLFVEALESAIDIRRMLGGTRARFGEHMAAMLSDSEVDLLPTLLFSIADPAARELSLGVLHRDLLQPLADWLGGDDRVARATRILMLCSGYTVHRRLLPLAGGDGDEARQWLAAAIQRIVDLDIVA